MGCNNSKELKKSSPKKPKNIILMIGDGMGVAQIYAGISESKDALNLEQFKNIGFSKTSSFSHDITDSGAGGTAIAIGEKTYNGAIGVNKDSLAVKSILEYAEDYGKATGLVATSTVTHATPASFIAHVKSRYLYEDIALQFLNTDVDVFIGGGLNHFMARTDSLDLIDSLKNRNYQLAYQLADFEAIKTGKLAGLLYDDSPPKYSEGRGDMLEVSSGKAIELLNQNEEGFFLMIEGSQIDWGGHDNDAEYVVDEMLDFDRTIGRVLDFAKADGNTLVIVTADHETGGLTLIDDSLNRGKTLASFSTDDHSSVMVPVFAFGPEAEKFSGIYENTELYHKMMAVFGFKAD